MWLAALVLSNVFAQLEGSAFSNNLTGGKQQAQQILNANFPSQSGSPAQVVVTTGNAFTGSANEARTSRLVDALRSLPHVSAVVSPFSPQGATQIARNGHIAYLRVQFDQQAGELAYSCY